MAYRHRDAKFVLNVHGRWDKRTDDERCIAWARAFFRASAPYASGGAYVNFMTEEETDRVAAAYGANYDRLAQIKPICSGQSVPSEPKHQTVPGKNRG